MEWETEEFDIIEVNPDEFIEVNSSELSEYAVRAIKLVDGIKMLFDKEKLERIKQEKCITEKFELKIKKVGKEIYSVYFKEI